MINTSVVIPAYNEEAVLDATIAQVMSYLKSMGQSFEVIVVDDASRDRTPEIAQIWAQRHLEIRMIRLPQNRGKGYAVRTGMLAAQGEVAFFLDADGSTSIEAFDRFAKALNNGADLVVASRWLPESKIDVSQPIHRRLLGRVAHLVSRWVVGTELADFSCGFKAFNRRARQALFPLARINRWMFDHELIWLAQQAGLHIVELPVHWCNRQDSRVRPVPDAIRSLVELLQIRLYTWMGRYR